MAATADRLSALPDAALLRILSMAPAKAAAATTALSRRWRPLWRRAAALNLDSRPYNSSANRNSGNYSAPPFNSFFSDAAAAAAADALAAAPGSASRGSRSSCGKAPTTASGRVAALLADRALAELEELAIACDHTGHERYYTPPVASLPCAATLRVLELQWCNLELQWCNLEPPLAFPRLAVLRLQNCYLLQGHLQAMVDAAPALTDLSLVNVAHSPPPEQGGSAKKPDYDSSRTLPFRLRCPTATALVLRMGNAREQEIGRSADSGIELDMPSLRFFRYRGYPIKLSLTSPAPGLAHVDLDASLWYKHVWEYQPVLRMLPSLSRTTTLKLRLHYIEDLVDDGEIVLPTFPNLKLLDLDAEYQYMDGKTAVAMARLLRSCPAMAELRLRLNMRRDYHYECRIEAACPTGGPFGESMDRFERLAAMSGARRANMELGEVPDAMTNSSAFKCLQTSLRKVTLQFEGKEVNFFQVQLAKFLAEKAMVLEEIHVYDGSHFWPDHLLHKVARWRADSFRRRNLMDMSGFKVYQLANPVVISKDQRV